MMRRLTSSPKPASRLAAMTCSALGSSTPVGEGAQPVAHRVEAGQVGRHLARHDQVVGRERLDEAGARDLGDGGAGGGEQLDGLVEAGLHAGLEPLARQLAHHADPQRRRRHRDAPPPPPAGTGASMRRGVQRVVPADDLVQQRRVEHGPGHRAGLVEAAGHRHDALARDAAVGRLDPDGAGQRAGLADRAAGVGADRQRRQPGRDGGGGPAAGAAGRPVGVPGVAGRAVRRVLGGRAHRELVEVGLAEDRHVGLAQPGDHGGVVRRHPALEDPRAARRGLAHGAQQVLHGDRHAGQVAEPLAGGAAPVDVGRGRQGALGVDVQEGVDRAVDGRRSGRGRPGSPRTEVVSPAASAAAISAPLRAVRSVVSGTLTPRPGSWAPGTGRPRGRGRRRAPPRGSGSGGRRPRGRRCVSGVGWLMGVTSSRPSSACETVATDSRIWGSSRPRRSSSSSDSWIRASPARCATSSREISGMPAILGAPGGRPDHRLRNGPPTPSLSAMSRFHTRLLGDERAQLEACLDDNRAEIARLLDGLTDEEARRRLVPSLTTLLGLVKHATFVEQVWFQVALAGRTRSEIGVPETVDESFTLTDEDTVASIGEHYLRVCEESRALASGFDAGRRGAPQPSWSADAALDPHPPDPGAGPPRRARRHPARAGPRRARPLRLTPPAAPGRPRGPRRVPARAAPGSRPRRGPAP